MSTKSVSVVIVLTALLLAGLSAHPLPKFIAQQDMLEHVVGFLAFALSLQVAFPRLRFLAVLAACLLVAVLIEFGQLLLPLRTASATDVLAGILGALLGGGLARWWLARGSRGGDPGPSAVAGDGPPPAGSTADK